MEFLSSHHFLQLWKDELGVFNCSSTNKSSFTSTSSILVQEVVLLLVYRPGETDVKSFH